MKERTSIMTVEVCPTLVNSLSLLPFLFIQNLNSVHDGCWGGSEVKLEDCSITLV